MARKFQILTDSGCDMPKEYLQKHGVVCVPLGFAMDNINYEGECGEKIAPKAFYEKLRLGSMPTTYQVTAETATGNIEPFLTAGKDVFVLAFSSGLSGTADSFFLARKKLLKKYPKRKIAVVDSLCASMGQGLLLDYLIQKADTGASLEETEAYIEGLKKKICHHFTVDSLFHLKRGGRISGATAVIGSILKIKPVMYVDGQGKLAVKTKIMGRKKALNTLVDELFESMNGQESPIFISHGDCIEDAEYVKGLIQQRLPSAKITTHYIGPVIGSHSGAGTLALFNKGEGR
jgi:DegV family protein with EDD domain